jgi:hypothetical protein
LHAAVVGSAAAIAALAMSQYADIPTLVRSLIGPAIAVPAVIGAT